MMLAWCSPQPHVANRLMAGESSLIVATSISSSSVLTKDVNACSTGAPKPAELAAALLTGGFDKHYAFGLTTALVTQHVRLDVIGSDDVDCPEMHTTPLLTFLNLRGSKRKASLLAKIKRVTIYYARLIGYAATAKPTIFHILWNSKFQVVDRILLMLYYKLLGKKIVFTVHNVNAGKRDSNDSLLNRLTLRAQYHLADHLFVHTAKMKHELREDFGVHEEYITVIPFGINNAIPNTDLTPAEAKQRLGIGQEEKTILFFGAIRPSKGLEYLVDALLPLVAKDPKYRLIIAAFLKEGSEQYMDEIQRKISDSPARHQILQRIEFIPDEETELYFKAADVLALPYTHIFQSGVLFLAYSFGLPVVASDVGSFREDIVEGKTGFVCKPRDPADLARALEVYFESDLFKTLDRARIEIRDSACVRHSWKVVATMTRNVYAKVSGGSAL